MATPAGLRVVDASVLASLLFGEPRAPEAAGLLDGCRLVAPALIRYEIANVCLKKIADRPRRRKALLEALGLLDEIGLHEVGVPAIDVVELARAKRITVYDAAYLWVARTLGAPLVTFDEKLKAAL
jgi:predicted nucleic acid-binding protein